MRARLKMQNMYGWTMLPMMSSGKRKTACESTDELHGAAKYFRRDAQKRMHRVSRLLEHKLSHRSLYYDAGQPAEVAAAMTAATSSAAPINQPVPAAAAVEPTAMVLHRLHVDERKKRAAPEGGPVQSKIRVPLCAARTLNATGQSRVTLSLR